MILVGLQLLAIGLLGELLVWQYFNPSARTPYSVSLSDLENLYVYSSQEPQKIPLRSVSSAVTEMTTERIRRQEHFRTIGVHAFPVPGVLPSEVLQKAMPQLPGARSPGRT